jgi:hypothetical protein
VRIWVLVYLCWVCVFSLWHLCVVARKVPSFSGIEIHIDLWTEPLSEHTQTGSIPIVFIVLSSEVGCCARYAPCLSPFDLDLI